MDKYINKADQSIDGSSIQDDWFPQVDVDIFLSHSHTDEKLALSLAGWLSIEFNLKVFVDSCVWGYADVLLREIDNNFCKIKDSSSYSYEERNKSTAHVHMMLSTAITQLMDKTECIVFLNTSNSITTDEAMKKTKSPWIFYELMMMKLIRKKTIKEHRHHVLLEYAELKKSAEASMKINYRISLDHLIPLSDKDLFSWKKTYSQNELYYPYPMSNGIKRVPFALDSLYEIKVPKR
ncbi:hypothetical protein OM416_07795 [Paenibacillus sp. LS1]|uniref:hypothetical protein n=1 Tax=Paenibacillus sp. LS1 TaxID=2992120 RepID=UPI00223220C3|nr:hypothetical protein [Paenibacillus sp. LS1]MCW3791478.1 hypothetical protein [Paenibacillus sp. LS1]